MTPGLGPMNPADWQPDVKLTELPWTAQLLVGILAVVLAASLPAEQQQRLVDYFESKRAQQRAADVAERAGVRLYDRTRGAR